MKISSELKRKESVQKDKMSAESPRRGVHKGAQVVSPQPVSDRSIIDSVAGIINDIVPQAYTGVPNSENRESIAWARFEYADVNDPALYPDYNEGSGTPPLLLVLGYGTGVQVWLVAASGEATEVLSWRQGVVRTLRILPNPKSDDDLTDLFETKRPMVAICDSAGPGPQFCNISFISLKTGEQVRSIKFKNPVSDISANRRSVVVTFPEKIAVFDARSLEDVLTVTTCYPSPGPNPNPVALGTRWLAYSEKKLLPARRSSGGSEGEGVQSYTATVLHAAKSLGKGLRGLGETVASSLTGNSVTPLATNNVGCDVMQPGVITILDLQAAKEDKELDDGSIETVVAHFTAHSDAIVAMTFDLTGALLMTADKRGHDFHVFRIQPHPGGPSLAAVHHLYVLHRGDTTAKVQDMTFSSDARWAAVSTVRGTTHVFPVAPYGGPIGVRTHSTPHVVNRLSRFHRSAGLTDDGTRSHSPVSHAEVPQSVYPYSNPRLPPYPHPTILHPLAQIRQPSTLNHVNSQSQPRPQQRQRLQSEDSGSLPLKICACFAPQRAWIYAQRDSTNKGAKRAVDSLFVMACHGNMIQYDLEPKPAAGVPKEKVCDDTTVELDVEAKGQWPLLRSPGSLEIPPPLPMSSQFLGVSATPKNIPLPDSTEDRWLSQVEIVTHAGPHRRLWMGPQFIFKTYNAPSGVAVNLVEAEAIEVGVTSGSRPARSNPVNMPHAATRPLVPVVIDGSGSSYEQSPRFLEVYGDSLENETLDVGGGENQLREDLAEAMLETAAATHRVPGRRVVVERAGQPVTKVVNPLGTVIIVSADEEDITSSQEFDTESTVEPSRSVCAEEGPASLSDYEQEGQTIKNLTEICAEMRSMSEPAIDSIPNDSIKDVLEKKTLCAEAAKLKSKGEINFDRVEAFRDVPTTLSLCAEAGEIPNSPMTRARANPWNQRSKNDEQLQQRNIAKAKYVVNYDEDSMVLMEKKGSDERQPRAVGSSKGRSYGLDKPAGTVGKAEDTLQYSQKPLAKNMLNEKKESKIPEKGNCSLKQVPHEGDEKSTVKKHNNTTIVPDEKSIEEAEKRIQTEACKEIKVKKKKQQPQQANKGAHIGKQLESALLAQVVDPCQDSAVTMLTETEVAGITAQDKSSRKKNKNRPKDVEKFDSTFETIKESEIQALAAKDLCETTESFVELKELDMTLNADKNQLLKDSSLQDADMTATLCDYELNLPSLDSLPVEDFSCDYHIVDTSKSHKNISTSSCHSNEDIEHIDSSEVTEIPKCDDSQEGVIDIVRQSEKSMDPMLKRKTNTNINSEVAMEDSSTSGIAQTTSEDSREILKNLGTETVNAKPDSDVGFQNVRKCSTISSDDDIEHLYRSELPEASSAEYGASKTALESKVGQMKAESAKDIFSKGVASNETMEHHQVDEISMKRSEGTPIGPRSETREGTKVKSRNRKKREDIIVIDSNTCDVEVTFVEPLARPGGWSKSKTPEKDLVEEIDKCAEPMVTEPESLTPRKVKTKVREGSQKKDSATTDSIEIIDIDAMQKAEMENADIRPEITCTVNCKVSGSRCEVSATKSRKTKRSRKINSDEIKADISGPACLTSAKQKLLEKEICLEQQTINPEPSQAPTPCNSWSSIVKKKTDQHTPEVTEAASSDHKELELEPPVSSVTESPKSRSSMIQKPLESEYTDIVLQSREDKKFRKRTENETAKPDSEMSFVTSILHSHEELEPVQENSNIVAVDTSAVEESLEPQTASSRSGKSKNRSDINSQKCRVSPEVIRESEIAFEPQIAESPEPQSVNRKNKKVKSKTDVASEKIPGVSKILNDNIPEVDIQETSNQSKDPPTTAQKSKQNKNIVKEISGIAMADYCSKEHIPSQGETKGTSRRTRMPQKSNEMTIVHEPEPPFVPVGDSDDGVQSDCEVRESNTVEDSGQVDLGEKLNPAPGDSELTPCPSKEPSPEPELFVAEKKSDSEQEIIPERSSSSDDLNANTVPMDTEEDNPARENGEKMSGTGISGIKKGKAKKKKRR